jgi:hypothetical protein
MFTIDFDCHSPADVIAVYPQIFSHIVTTLSQNPDFIPRIKEVK